MFYSHEILSNSQYGVSTIWLVATVGKTSHRGRLSRKAIQEVNVPKACEKIIDPGAPLALRLQGNLLYGVSRVFAQQCHYVLSDAEKTQSDMLTFFRVMQTSELDPRAGKAKRYQITLEDDPSFDVMNILPNFDLFNNNNKESIFVSSQTSAQSVSQMTPLSQGTNSFCSNPSFLPLNLPPSSHSAGSYRLPSDLGQDSLLSRPFKLQETTAEFSPFGEDHLDPISSIGLNFDGDGNLVGIDEPDPEFPPLPMTNMHEMMLLGRNIEMPGVARKNNEGALGGDNVLILGEDALPDAEPFPKQPRTRKPSTSPSSETLSSSTTVQEIRAVATLRRGRPRKIPQMVDERDHVSRKEFLRWTRDYLDNMKAGRKKPRTATPAQARKNAYALLFESGIVSIGLGQNNSRISHPLAKHFAGSALRASIQGKYPEELEEKDRGRRRTFAEAFQEDEVENRRIRPIFNTEYEFGRGMEDGFGSIIRVDESVPEIGMEAAPPLEDGYSSSMVPWSRPPSIVPGSSIRGPESAQKARLAPSPSFPRGSALGAIERYSDRPDLADGSDNFPMLHSQDSSLEYGDLGLPVGDNVQQTTQNSISGLDQSCLQFLAYTTDKARELGMTRSNGRSHRFLIDFEKIASPGAHDKRVAAQAFLHVLTLLSKDQVTVEQSGIENHQPFGTIHIGVIYDPEVEDPYV